MSTRKDKEYEYRRGLIIQAAREVFAENGFNLTTIEQIAEKAEIARATLYKFFSSKEELYICVLEDVFKAIYTIAEESLTRKAPAKIKFELFVENLFNHFAVNSGFFKILMHQLSAANIGDESRKRISEAHRKLNEIVAAAIAEGIKKREIKKTDPWKTMQMFNYMVYGCQMNILFANAGIAERREAAKFIIDIFFNGISIKGK